MSLIVHQICIGEGPVAYVVGCAEAKVAALIDPEDRHVYACERFLEARGLRLAWVLRTRPTDAPPARPGWSALLADLGASTESDDLGGDGIDLARAATIRPVPAWGDSDAAVVMQVRDRVLELTPERVELPAFDIGAGLLPDPFTLAFRSLCVQLGKQRVEAIPIAGSRTLVAWRVQDRVFTGRPVLAGGRGPLSEGTPTSLLALPPDTLVYPGALAHGVGLSSIGLELRVLDAGASDLANLRPTPTTSRSLGSDGARPPLPSGERDPKGFVSLVPEEAYRYLDTVRTLDLREEHLVREKLANAAFVTPRDLALRLHAFPKDAPLLFVCANGLRSSRFAEIAAQMGFTAVFHLVGGVDFWRESGLPLRAVAALPSASDRPE